IRHCLWTPGVSPAESVTSCKIQAFYYVRVDPWGKALRRTQIDSSLSPVGDCFFYGDQPFAGLLPANISSDGICKAYPIAPFCEPPQMRLPFEGERVVWPLAGKPDLGVFCHFAIEDTPKGVITPAWFCGLEIEPRIKAVVDG